MIDEFEIPLGNQRGLLGVFLAAHAIPDAIHILFTGVGCKSKAQRQIAHHDLVRDAGNKMVWADIGEREFIAGPLERLENLTLETVRRRGKAGLIFISGSAAAEFPGADLAATLRRIKRLAGCPVIYLPGGWEDDHFLAYARAMREVLRLVNWKTSPKKRKSKTVNIVGYFFDRYEEDRQADCWELYSLCLSVGYNPGSLFFCGDELKELQRAWQAEVNVVLPFYPLPLYELEAITGRPAVKVDLPLGPVACRRFEEQLQMGISGEKKPPLKMSYHQLETTELIAGARRRLAGLRALVVAESPVAAGMVELLSELEVSVPLVVILDRSLGGKKYFLEKLKEYGVDFPAEAALENPGYSCLEKAACQLEKKDGRLFDLIIAPDLWLPEEITIGAAWLEVGFPSHRRHVFHKEPVLGWGGVYLLVQRLLSAAERIF